MVEPYYTDGDVTLHHGDALAVARTFTSGSVQTIVTSPPYFGLRDYGADGQLGAEATVQEYVVNMVALFRELRRALTDDGTLWLNLGDSYVASPRGNKPGDLSTSSLTNPKRQDSVPRLDTSKLGLPAKNLIGVPWRVAFGLQDDGWILRSDIIWAKPNPMPESVTDRPTKAHEYLFLFAKQPRYYYDAAVIKEESLYPVGSREAAKQGQLGGKGAIPGTGQSSFRAIKDVRNKRSVWEIPTAPFPGAHFAVYPPELIRPCILAGSRPGDTVLDPFSGSGTTGMVANYEGRKYVGIDLNAEYLDLSLRTRFREPALDFGDWGGVA